MRKQRINQRPPEFRLDHGHPLANGLVFSGLGRSPGSTRYHDSSPFGNHGTLTAMDPATDWVWSPELNRFGLEFTSYTQYVLLPDIFASAASGTICQWLNTTTTTTAIARLSFQGGYTTSRLYLGINVASSQRKATYRVGNQAYTVDSTVLGEVFHLALTWNAAETRVYVNGVAAASSAGGSWGQTGGYTRINYASDSGYDFPGKIADTLLYNRYLSPAEISALSDPSNVMLSGLILPPRRRLFAVVGGGGPAALSASIAQTLPKLTQAAAADVDCSAAIAQTLPKLTQAVSAERATVQAPYVVAALTFSEDAARYIVCDISSLTLQLGDVLLVLIASDGTSTFAVIDANDYLTSLFSESTGVSRLTAAYRTYTNPITYVRAGNTSSNESFSVIIYQIRHAVAIECGTAATGATQYPDPPSLNPDGWNVDMSLWFAVAGWDGDVSVAEYPTGANRQTIRETGADGCGVAASSVVSSTASFNPSLFALSASEDTVANTIVLRGGSPVYVAQTLPKLTQAAAADVDCSAAIAQTLPKLTQAAEASHGVVELDCAIAQTLPKLTQAVAADADTVASIAQTLPKLTQEAVVTHPNAERDCLIAQTLPRLGQAISAAVQVAAEINQTLPKLRQSAYVGEVGTPLDCAITQTLPSLTQSAAIGGPAYNMSRVFWVPVRTATFIVQARTSTFIVQP